MTAGLYKYVSKKHNHSVQREVVGKNKLVKFCTFFISKPEKNLRFELISFYGGKKNSSFF